MSGAPPGSTKATSLREPERERDNQSNRKKPLGGTSSVAALGILRALDPHAEPRNQLKSRSEEHLALSSNSIREKERKGFWERSSKEGGVDEIKFSEKGVSRLRGREKDVRNDRDERKNEKREDRKDEKREEKRDEDREAELTRMIGTHQSISRDAGVLV